jgi:hypothetical protein
MRLFSVGPATGFWSAPRRALWFVLFAGIPSGLLFSQQAAPADETARTILATKCAVCHGESHMSDLDVRDRAGMIRGGKRGPAVVPGISADSLLFRAVKREGELRMPPGDKPLSAAEIEAVRQWIDSGAKWDANGNAQARDSWWSFRRPERPPLPTIAEPAAARNPIDIFVLAKLGKQGLKQAPAADRRTLIRRAYFDLHGLPPSPREVEDFVTDSSPDAYEKLIDRLLASPRYGERWGRYWLDLVRYADTSGFETDHFFPSAWRYRDYVIDSFNNDKPYNTFIQEQIAADEIWAPDMDLEGTQYLPKNKAENAKRRIGTSLYTIGSFPIEFTYYGDQMRAEWESDAVDVTGAAFLGLTIGCARCHDHKFDPVRQRDYYSFAAFFSGSEEREIPLVSQFDIETYNRQFPLLAQLEALKQMARGGRGRAQAADGGVERASPPPQQPSASTPPVDRTALMRQIGELYSRLPARYATANVLAHSETVPETHILVRGDWRSKGEKVEPGFPPVLNPGPPINEPKGVLFVPQRRKALALWMTSPENPLVARVMVNRIWQGHFGAGIVGTPNDFGRQGDVPTHPELLDWLATEFVSRGWSIKQMHRLIMLSNTYRASSLADPVSLQKDPENRFLSRMNRRRLDGDAVRDTILAVSGDINLKMGGVGIIPPLTKEELQAARMPNLWPPNPDPAEYNRRSIYLQMKRSLTLPILQIFDAPDPAVSCPRRDVSTVAPQALALMNSDFSVTQAEKFALRIQNFGAQTPEARIDAGWQMAFARPPSERERSMALEYLGRNSLPRLCLLMFNMSEFIYAD